MELRKVFYQKRNRVSLDYFMNDRIKVIDSPPGSGKTSYAIQYINKLPSDIKVIYLTPYLDEVRRILLACKDKNFVQPDSHKGRGSKLTHLIRLVLEGENIVSTHALFSNITDELINALRVNNYILILDEVFQTVEKFDLTNENLKDEVKDSITKQDVDTLLEKKLITIQEDYSIKWLDLDNRLSKYQHLINMSERGLIYYVNGSLLLWTFPIEVFREGIFDEILILTHMFEAQLQAYYYTYFELEYVKYVVYEEKDQYKIKVGNSADLEGEWKTSVASLINIVEDSKLNKIGDIYYDARNHPYKSALSKNWFSDNPSLRGVLSKNLYNYFQNVTKSSSQDRLWTCFKEDISKIRGRSSIKSWLACNARATNNYADKTVLAYLINRYVNPFYDDFFAYKNITIDQDKYALSEMMQWIWRSGIRNGVPIELYIPSERMRLILKDYLGLGKV
jgi:hypothetical protein